MDVSRAGNGGGALPVDGMADLLPALIPVARGIAAAVGPRCEVVIHDIADPERLASTIVWIENGHVTGRQVGGPTTNLGLEALRNADRDPDRLDYRSQTSDGRQLRCSSTYFRDRNGRLIGALCVNVDVSAYVGAKESLEELIGDAGSPLEETFATDIDDVLAGLTRAAIARTGRPVSAMTREDKIEVLRELDAKGVFLVKRAVDRVARALRISRVTAYAYLQEVRGAPR
jgi:predicted transcriptional regulator YheO